jgi:hypothetical protein
VDVDARVRLQPGLDLPVLVGGVVVHDQVQVLVGIAAGEVAEEDQELLVPVPRLAQASDLAGGDLKRGEQRGGSVSDLVVGTALGLPGLHRQRILGPVQRLNLALLDHAEHDRFHRRVEIQADDVGDLGDKFGVGGELERLGPPRLRSVMPPSPQHRRGVDVQMIGEQPGRPMRNAELRRRRG